MAIKVGSSEVKSHSSGGGNINTVYAGNTKVFPTYAPTTITFTGGNNPSPVFISPAYWYEPCSSGFEINVVAGVAGKIEIDGLSYFSYCDGYANLSFSAGETRNIFLFFDEPGDAMSASETIIVMFKDSAGNVVAQSEPVELYVG